MSEAISNFQLEEALRNLNDPDINENFVGTFPANHMNKFIDYKSIISEKKGKHPFLIPNTDSSDKKVRNGGAYWTLNQKLTYFIHLVLID